MLIKCILLKDNSAQQIYKELKEVCGDHAIGYSSITR